ncbi:hypothetical protein NM688_g8923 [Phlebia brevispora]|uniref:Uncharacterized protein n=1 Tax=Phlebia brevispora TaxID=194682 RepID=A0ACC1RN92_9APHY|nr:hypothetical protein NM688_g8923 [Phlebia brevispora]
MSPELEGLKFSMQGFKAYSTQAYRQAQDLPAVREFVPHPAVVFITIAHAEGLNTTDDSCAFHKRSAVENNTPIVNGSHMTPDVNIKYVEQTIDLDNVPLDGGVLVKTLAMSVDPYLIYRMRDPNIPMFCPPMTVGEPADNLGVGKIVRSDDPKFKPGDFVIGYLNFQEYSVYPGKIVHFFKTPLQKVDKIPGIPWSVFTGTLGLAGMTAWSGLKVYATEKVKTAKTLFVSGGGGPVGTFVIEYAKIMAPHLKVIASAGTDEKVKIMKQVGADVAFNYKTEDTEKILRENGPIDIYWDNVAGPTLDAALVNMTDYGLIIACGSASSAVGTSYVKVTRSLRLFAVSMTLTGPLHQHFEEIFKRSITVNGFIVNRGPTGDILPQFHQEVVPLVLQKKISVFEQRYDGIKNAGQAMHDLHTGANTGKAVVIVADD